MEKAIFTKQQIKKMRCVLEQINKSEIVQESLINSTKTSIEQALNKKDHALYSECLTSFFASLNNQIVRLNKNMRDNDYRAIMGMVSYNEKMYNFICANVRFLSSDLTEKIYEINKKQVDFKNCGGEELKYTNFLEKAILEVREQEFLASIENKVSKKEKELSSLAKKQINLIKAEEKIQEKTRKILKKLKKVKLAKKKVNDKIKETRQTISDFYEKK